MVDSWVTVVDTAIKIGLGLQLLLSLAMLA